MPATPNWPPKSTPRLFVDQALESRAYEDVALPIGFGQTISCPYVVARMCELARLDRAGHARDLGRVLEIGLGCGYQAAVLARIAREVVALERIAALVGRTRPRLRELRINNVKPKHGDGMAGLKDMAPYDAIVIAAAFGEVPEALKQQLAEGGDQGTFRAGPELERNRVAHRDGVPDDPRCQAITMKLASSMTEQ